MGGYFRAFFVVTMSAVAAYCIAQGGAAGYGQGQGGGGGGFGGGGFGGGRGGFGGGGFDGGFAPPPEEKDKKSPDDDQTQGLWSQKSAVLTPGDRVEFKLKMKKGEVLLASATSDAFDPALSVEDGKGVVLTKNDDREEGDQSPFVIYRFSQDGDYVLKVLSYRSVSGGKFNMKMRTLMAIDAPMTGTTHTMPMQEPGIQQRIAFRIAAKKDTYYDLSRASMTKPWPRGTQMFRIIGSTGVDPNDFEMLSTPDGTAVFKALRDADYYAEYDSTGGVEMKTDYRIAQVLKIKPTEDLPLEFAPNELKIVEFEVKKEQIIRTTTPDGVVSLLTAPAGRSMNDAQDQAQGVNAFALWFLPNRSNPNDVVRVFMGVGTARTVLRSQANKPLKTQIRNMESLPAWQDAKPVNENLAIGESKLYLLKSSKSELMKVRVGATTFVPRFDIFRLSGELANSLMDRKLLKVSDDLYFPDEGTFLIRLSCDGFGGSGDFSMKRDTIAASPYTLGKAQTLVLDGTNFGLYSVNLEKGKRYQLMTDQPMKLLRADLLDDDGQFLVSQRIRFDSVDLQYFVPTRSGRHRLWLRGAPATRHFKFELHVPPAIGG